MNKCPLMISLEVFRCPEEKKELEEEKGENWFPCNPSHLKELLSSSGSRLKETHSDVYFVFNPTKTPSFPVHIKVILFSNNEFKLKLQPSSLILCMDGNFPRGMKAYLICHL